LGSWLCDLKQNPQLSESSATLHGLQTILFSKKNSKILELGELRCSARVLNVHELLAQLGAGIGMVSVAMAILRCNMGPGDVDDSILTTDVSTFASLQKSPGNG